MLVDEVGEIPLAPYLLGSPPLPLADLSRLVIEDVSEEFEDELGQLGDCDDAEANPETDVATEVRKYVHELKV